MPDTLLGGIAINEVLVDPNGTNNFDTDGDGVARGRDEFIELVNTSASAIDISGLELWDAGRDNWFTFPPSTILQPGAFVVVVRDVQPGGSLPTVTGDNLAFDAGFGSNVFNNGGDNIVVYDPTNDEFIQATYNGDTLDDPTATSPNTYLGFSSTATRVGSGEDFGNDQDGISIQRIDGGFVNDATPTPGEANVCFVSGTHVATPNGFRLIEDLRAGDRICTRSAGPQRIRWVFSREMSVEELNEHPSLRPVCLKGEDKLLVSKHHRVLVCGKIAQRMFGEDEVLIAAKELTDHFACEVNDSAQGLRYFHILLDAHHIINANGFAAESLYLGMDGIKSMTPDARQELARIFPSVANGSGFVPPTLCRTSVSGRRARHLAWRHSKNQRAILTRF